jgi:transposase-like protein
MSDLSNPIFHNETKARKWLEARIWPNGPVCPHCGVVSQATLMNGKTTRRGLYQCNACREPFSVTVGTLYERSHIPLHKWLAATHLIMASKKGISALQVGRLLGISKKSSWFLCHRIRESLRGTGLEPMGGDGKVVEADETYVGGKDKNKHANKREHRRGRPSGVGDKQAVYSLVERGGSVRSFHIGKVTGARLREILAEQVKRETTLMTDEASTSMWAGREYPNHQTVNHAAEEYVRGEAYTNTIESFFAIFKRGVMGTYHHISPQHLSRYLAEFDYRYSNRSALGIEDGERMSKSIPGIVGKRLTYRRIGERRERPKN